MYLTALTLDIQGEDNLRVVGLAVRQLVVRGVPSRVLEGGVDEHVGTHLVHVLSHLSEPDHTGTLSIRVDHLTCDLEVIPSVGCVLRQLHLSKPITLNHCKQKANNISLFIQNNTILQLKGSMQEPANSS